jgi:glutamate synthase domain-containing protein 1
MCGIAGLIYRNGGEHQLGRDITAMLQSMRHRGPDSTGFALYHNPREELVLRVKLAEGAPDGDLDLAEAINRRRREVPLRLRAGGAEVSDLEEVNGYTIALTVSYEGELKRLADLVESVNGVEVLSAGHALDIVKDLGDARTVARQYGLETFQGSHGIGHVRMATESDVDISNAHPYWAYPFSDVAVVHNGQITNYFQWRRRLERYGHRFASDCDSEVIAVYLAQQMQEGLSLEQAMQRSLDDLDGVFTYICVTEDALGMAKDELAAKPMVLYESEDMVALASEEIAIRAVIDREIDTYDPYEKQVMVWTR